MIFINTDKAKKPERKAATQPAITAPTPIEELILPKSFNSRIKAPSMAGMESKKENSPAIFLSTPHNKAPAIVLPEREIPGNTPKPWAKPIPNGSGKLFLLLRAIRKTA